MCLVNNYAIAKSLYEGKKKVITCYKVVQRYSENGHYKYESPYHYEYLWKNGWNKSGCELGLCNAVTIHYGIHCFRTKKEAKELLRWFGRSRTNKHIIITVTGHACDIIGANKKEIVFSKVKWDRPKIRPNTKTSK